MTLREVIELDLYRYCNHIKNSPKLTKISYILLYLIISRGFRAVFCYRICRYLHLTNKKYSYYIFNFFNLIINSIEISVKAEIGPGLFIVHPQCIVIGGGKLGKNVNVYQGVTIGLKKELNEYPVIGDNVHISAGSKVLGNVYIGNNSRIGANSVVIDINAPDNSLVIGSPAKVIKKIN